MNRKWSFLIILAVIFAAPLFIYTCKKDSKSTNPNVPKDSVVTQNGLPVVSTIAVSSITTTSATCGGSVSSEGDSPVTARGVCWSTSPIPSISDNKTTDGFAIGSFSSNLTGLFQGTTYNVRAYATNSVGTSYGLVQTFTTSYLPTDPSYFPIAVWLQDPLKNAVAYKSSGINTFVGLWNAFDEPQFNALKSSNLKVICAQNGYGLSLGNEPLVIGWMHGDEPDNAQWNATTQKYDPCIDPNIIIFNYHTIKQNDPSRPVYLNLGQGVAYNNYIGRGTCRNNTDMYKVSNNGYLAGCDIASFDIYPVNSIYPNVQNNLWYVALGIQNLIAWSGNKPSWCWIESTRIADTSPRKPTTSEVKSEVWMALIHGANGVGYFCHSFVTGATDEAAMLHDSEMSNAIRDINAQVTSLAVVLNSPSTTGYASVTSDDPSTLVDIMTKSYGGANYLFAIAMSDGQANATFTVTSGTSAEVMEEGRSITVSNGKFSDSFSPYAVHLYKITN